MQNASADLRDLLTARDEQLQRWQGLKFFRLTNDIVHEASYPESSQLHYALIVLMLLLESGANTVLFAQGSDLGILGGLFEALLISAANVLTSVVVGMLVLPQLNHRKTLRKVLGGIGTVVQVVFVLCFNLVAAHYRDLLEVSREEALRQAIHHAFSRPVELSLHGLVLLSIGLVVAALSLWKGYKADDCYPGYGAVSRRYRSAKDRFLELRRGFDGDIDYPHPGVED